MKQAIDQILEFNHYNDTEYHKYGDKYIDLMYTNMEKLLSLLSEKELLEKISGRKYTFINDIFARSVDTGNMKIFKYLISKGANDFEYALRSAIEEENMGEENMEIVKYLITDLKYPSLYNALLRAAYSGNMEIVKYVISQDVISPRTRSLYQDAFNTALSSAASGYSNTDTKGNMKVVQYLVEQYSSRSDESGSTIEEGANNFGWARSMATTYGNVEIANYLTGYIDRL